MNLLEFITHLRNPSTIEDIVLKENRDIDIDYADIYLEESLSAYSNIYFFDAEQLDGKIEMELNGIKYVNLFPLDYLQDLFEEYSAPGDSDLDTTNKILSFRMNDA